MQAFIQRWRESEASERANFSLFAPELCNLLEVPRPEPAGATTAENAYVFERAVTFHHADGHTSAGRIDLYKRGCFVMEAKQGSDPKVATPLFGMAPAAGRAGTARRGTSQWNEAMQKAKNQAERYARALPASEVRPPFLIVVDVGHSIELYSEFSRTGGDYVPFPDPQSYRIMLEDLASEDTRTLLRTVWLNPMSLDPPRRSARVTREIADKLAKLARSLESQGYGPERVAAFVMRVIFTMFAEDVRLLPPESFKRLLESSTWERRLA